ncbi:hypothetical protein HY837_05255 [archaeon]|nr:hypothetical protein [archaeon]
MGLEKIGRFKDTDGTEKFVYKNDKGVIEITWLKNKSNTDVFCIPTHYYCSLGCTFCHLTSENPLSKGMKPITLEELTEAFNESLKFIDRKQKTVFSFMGVGDSFMNKELIVDFYETMRTESSGLALATIIPRNEFKYFTQKVIEGNIPLKIHFSLHTPFSNVRQKLIPYTDVSVEEALQELCNYRERTLTEPMKKELLKCRRSADNTEIHYTIIKNVNDGEAELTELIRLGQKYKIPLKILKFNPTDGLERSEKEDYWFERLIEEYGAPGANIGSSCGQFTKKYYLNLSEGEEKEFSEWERAYRISQ